MLLCINVVMYKCCNGKCYNKNCCNGKCYIVKYFSVKCCNENFCNGECCNVKKWKIL